VSTAVDPVEEGGLPFNAAAMLEFLHLAPVGLMRMRSDGEMLMMNPVSAQLLAHIGLGSGPPNLLRLLDPITPDVRTLLGIFEGDSGTVFENYRVPLPEGDDPRRPLALGLTVMLLPSDPGSLMVVVTDESNAVRLERLRKA
jgi:hypothetical protein